jgi:hypothetical protein
MVTIKIIFFVTCISLKEERTYNKILVPFDNSKPSETAL